MLGGAVVGGGHGVVAVELVDDVIDGVPVAAHGSVVVDVVLVDGVLVDGVLVDEDEVLDGVSGEVGVGDTAAAEGSAGDAEGSSPADGVSAAPP